MRWYSQLTLAQADVKPAPGGSVPVEQGPAAETNATTTSPPPGGPPLQRGLGNEVFIYVALFILLMWVMVFLPQRRERKKHAAMLAELKKGDRVQTIGGALGTVVELRDREVILKVDEASNTRMRFTRAAIQGVVEESKD